MSPVFMHPSATMPPTTLFNMHAGFHPAAVVRAFPPCVDRLRNGIRAYRKDRGYESAGTYPHDIIARLLRGERFDAGDSQFRITDLKIHQIATPVIGSSISNVEMNLHLLIAPIAAAVAAHPFLGKGAGKETKTVKDQADGAATEAQRTALNRRPINGTIKGGEGGRDGMKRSGALYLGELVGTQYGPQIDFYVDPLEVTNATKVLDPKGAWGGVGHGWSPELADPMNWFPGFSGASSLMLAVDASHVRSRPISDFVYFDKVQVPHQVVRDLPLRQEIFTNDPKELVGITSTALKLFTQELRFAALARARHMTTMRRWIEADIAPHNISTPSDGDAMFAPALAAGALHFAGLTGGVVESTISAAIGIPMGVMTYLQFVSHDRLGEHKENADLRKEEHRFGFSEREYRQMLLTRLFDSEHIGHTLRTITRDGEIESYIGNAAYAAYRKGRLTKDEYKGLLERYRRISSGEANGERFRNVERGFLDEALTKMGFIDVRRVLGFSDIVKSRNWLAAVSAITPNKWAPLEGIRVDGNRLVVDTLVVGGSSAVYILETEIEEV